MSQSDQIYSPSREPAQGLTPTRVAAVPGPAPCTSPIKSDFLHAPELAPEGSVALLPQPGVSGTVNLYEVTGRRVVHRGRVSDHEVLRHAAALRRPGGWVVRSVGGGRYARVPDALVDGPPPFAPGGSVRFTHDDGSAGRGMFRAMLIDGLAQVWTDAGRPAVVPVDRIFSPADAPAGDGVSRDTLERYDVVDDPVAAMLAEPFAGPPGGKPKGLIVSDPVAFSAAAEMPVDAEGVPWRAGDRAVAPPLGPGVVAAVEPAAVAFLADDPRDRAGNGPVYLAWPRPDHLPMTRPAAVEAADVDAAQAADVAPLEAADPVADVGDDPVPQDAVGPLVGVVRATDRDPAGVDRGEDGGADADPVAVVAAVTVSAGEAFDAVDAAARFDSAVTPAAASALRVDVTVCEPADPYARLLAAKQLAAVPVGFEVDPADLCPALKPHQRLVVPWALRLGRAALFEGCGLGKTLQQLDWGRLVSRHADGPVLVLAPLAVTQQTVREGEKFGIPVRAVRSDADVGDGINIANYQILHKLRMGRFAGVIPDESGILKNFTGRTKRELVDACRDTPYRLCCTATPAPNDYVELGNHAEFLGIMPANEMLMRWFINDQSQAGTWRLKHHATADFWDWVASWAACLDRPSDIGCDDAGYELPPLERFQHTVAVDATSGAADGQMFRDGKLTATTLHKEMRLTADARAARAAELVAAEPGRQWTVWCNTNYEADALLKAIPGAVDVRGSDARAEEKIAAFEAGKIRVVILKPSMCGFGLNLQFCCRAVVVGLSYSFEQLYQLVRRHWRFGQPEAVHLHVVTAATEGNVLAAVQVKEAADVAMRAEMVAAMRRASSLVRRDAGRRALRADAGDRRMTVPAWLTNNTRGAA